MGILKSIIGKDFEKFLKAKVLSIFDSGLAMLEYPQFSASIHGHAKVVEILIISGAILAKKSRILLYCMVFG